MWKLNKARIRTMQKHKIDCAQVKADLKAIASESNKIEFLVGIMVDILDAQPKIVPVQKGEQKLEVMVFGARYWLSNRKGAIAMHSITDSGMLMDEWSNQTPDSRIREAFEKLPRLATH
jgi:hypothetical protein